MASTSPGYGITIRVDGPASAQPVSEITQVISAAGAAITALDVVESVLDRVVIDVTCDAIDAEHAEAITAALSKNPNLNVRKVSDRTFLLHLGGKIEIASKVPLKTRDDLSRAYTPGVARISQAIAKDPADLRRLTIKRNTVAVVTDGSAVLGLGNLGPGAALPVMEGKAALFKRFADVDAWPVCLDTQDVDEIVRTVQIIAPVYGGINLEDISAPRCFEIEARLRDLLDIPVFHDDQHGTAIVVLAALTNALKLVKKDLANTKIVLTGFGRVGHGAREILDLLPITEVSPEEFLNKKFDSPVYTQLELEDYYDPKNGGEFDKKEFYSTPENYKSSFGKYVSEADMYIPCHYWSDKADVIITNDDLKKENRRISVIADISCDIAGPIASTIRPSTIASPVYGYDPQTQSEVDFMNENAIAVMAVDNLPCELPLDASEDFGNELIKEVFDSLLLEDTSKMIERGSETDLNGNLMPNYTYLQDYVVGK